MRTRDESPNIVKEGKDVKVHKKISLKMNWIIKKLKLIY